MARDFCGFVLAGGKSVRMGQDKTSLKPAPDSPDLLRGAWNVLSSVISTCFVSHGADRAFADYPCVADGYPNAGPAGAILTALETTKKLGRGNAFILACDMPMFTSGLIKNLLQAHAKAPGASLATLYQDEANGRYETLAGVYSIKAIPTLAAAVEKGEFSLYRMARRLRIYPVIYGAVVKKYFINCNTPEDLRAAGELWRGNDALSVD